MFERYTESARQSLFFAREEAARVGSPFIETEHLLLGVFRADPAILQRLPDSREIEAVRAELFSIARTAEPSLGRVGAMDAPLSYAVKNALALAAEECESLGHYRIESSHLILGLLRNADSPASRFLGRNGINHPGFRAELSERGPLDPHEPTSRIPDRIAQLQQEMQDRFRRRGIGIGPGFAGVGSGGGSWTSGSSGRIERGRFSSSRQEDDWNVSETHYFHGGHELTIIEKTRLSENGRFLQYKVELTGPGEQKQQFSADFEVPDDSTPS